MVINKLGLRDRIGIVESLGLGHVQDGNDVVKDRRHSGDDSGALEDEKQSPLDRPGLADLLPLLQLLQLLERRRS